MTPPPDASREGLVQMSDQELAQRCDQIGVSIHCAIADRNYADRVQLTLFQAARRLRAERRGESRQFTTSEEVEAHIRILGFELAEAQQLRNRLANREIASRSPRGGGLR